MNVKDTSGYMCHANSAFGLVNTLSSRPTLGNIIIDIS